MTDRLAIVADENDIDYKQFRLTGTRDYTLPAERCVDVEADGVTLNVDLARSDLLLETEVQRFAEPIASPNQARRVLSLDPRIDRVGPAPRRHARLPGKLVRPAHRSADLRRGANAAHRPRRPAHRTGRRLVLQVANEHLADGLAQWPGTRDLILARLGPTTLVVDESAVPAITERMKELGLKMRSKADACRSGFPA